MLRLHKTAAETKGIQLAGQGSCLDLGSCDGTLCDLAVRVNQGLASMSWLSLLMRLSALSGVCAAQRVAAE
jgi:hypothetical protein